MSAGGLILVSAIGRCNGVTFVPAPNPGVGAERAPAVAHEGAAGHLHLADEVPAVGQRAGANRVTMSIRPLITKTCWPIDLR